MRRETRDLQRYSASDRVNHWGVAICFILLALSGLAFFHPAFFPLTALFGGGPWTRILHPYLGLLLFLLFLSMALRFWRLNVLEQRDREWISKMPHLMNGGDEHEMPPQGKYNGGQKLVFWGLVGGIALIVLSGLLIWRAWWTPPVTVVRVAAVLHALAAVWLIGIVIVHVYAAIWTRGTIRAMVRGTVSRAWAKQHHRDWYRKMTGDNT